MFLCSKKGGIFRYPVGAPLGTLGIPKRKCPHFRPNSSSGYPERSDFKVIAIARVTIKCRPIAALYPAPRGQPMINWPLRQEDITVTLSRSIRAKEVGIEKSYSLGLTSNPPRSPLP